MRRILLAVLALALLSVPVSGALDSIQPMQLSDTRRTFCTAFSIDESVGMWQTAAHCVDAAEEAGWEFVVGGYEASVVFKDAEVDIAVVLSKAKAPALTLSKEAPKVGDVVVVKGFPYGLPRLITTEGKVAARFVPITGWGPVDILDLTVAGGNSGSPVLWNGKVVGVLVAKFVGSEHSVSVTWENVKRLTGSYYQHRQ